RSFSLKPWLCPYKEDSPGHATENCKAKGQVGETEGWTKVGKGKGKAPEGGGQTPVLPSTSSFKQGEGADVCSSETAKQGGTRDIVDQEVAPEEEATVSVEKHDHITKHQETYFSDSKIELPDPAADSEEDVYDEMGGTMDIITDEFDRPLKHSLVGVPNHSGHFGGKSDPAHQVLDRMSDPYLPISGIDIAGCPGDSMVGKYRIQYGELGKPFTHLDEGPVKEKPVITSVLASAEAEGSKVPQTVASKVPQSWAKIVANGSQGPQLETRVARDEVKEDKFYVPVVVQPATHQCRRALLAVRSCEKFELMGHQISTVGSNSAGSFECLPLLLWLHSEDVAAQSVCLSVWLRVLLI
ncbi:hypothetical protein U1Q18_049282, partial [Sarracenia purpurea var. burkii]